MSVSFGELLEKAARIYADKPAVTCEGRTKSWREIYARCLSLASGLEALGLKPGDRVAFLGYNSDALFECFFAPSLAGLETIVMNFRWSVIECASALVDCSPKALIVDAAHADLGRCALTQSGLTLHLIEISPTGPAAISYESLATRGGAPTTIPSRDDDTLVIYFTGGTTGRSKGVMLSHWNLFTNAMGAPQIMGNVRDSAQLVMGPMFHLAPGSRIFSAVLLNIHSVIMPRFDIIEMMQLIERHRIHSLTLVPTMMHMILNHPDFPRFDLSSVGQITLGGSPTPLDLLKKVIAAFPAAKLNNGYGMTEMSPMLAALTSDYHVLEGPKAGKLNSVGRPVPYLDIRIFDENDCERSQGEIGEIVARGPTVMKGYLNRPDENAVALRGGWFHTGDMGYFDREGFLYICGRSKDMIISGGENVYPAEIEDVISTHEAVSQVAVIGLPSETWGEVVHAVIILVEGAFASADDIIAHCRTQLAGYKCPRSVTFRREPMPLSGANKILKSDLRAQVLQQLGDS